MTINVVVADDHPIVRYGIRRLLEEREMIHLVGEAANSSELVNLLAKAPCDILVTDFSMPGGNFKDGLFLIGYVRRYFPHIKIIVVTMLENLAILRGMLKLGVHSILSKLDEQSSIADIVCVVADGSRYIPAGLATRLHDSVVDDTEIDASKLSGREVEVVRLFVSGLTISEIAFQLSRSVKTVSSQKTNAMRKLGLDRDVDLYHYATRTGIT
ncbi:response regulator [Pandoraea sp.]|uniref:response regulator n=1 Tax=Pandoraea sp. TaxID=1883445 RepID=UPI0035B291AF